MRGYFNKSNLRSFAFSKNKNYVSTNVTIMDLYIGDRRNFSRGANLWGGGQKSVKGSPHNFLDEL